MGSEAISTIKEKLTGKTKVFLVLGCAGVLLIFLSGFFKTEEKKTPAPESFSLDTYITDTEQSLKTIISSITGEKSPVVMVTAESSVRQVYATESKSTGSGERAGTEESYVLVKGSGGIQDPVKVTEIQPVIKGVVVVSAYADNFTVKEKIIDAVRTALDLSSSKVCVVSAQKQS